MPVKYKSDQWYESEPINITTGDVQIGSVTVSNTPLPTSVIGNVTISNTARTITGNLTISDSKAFIGLVTIGGGLSNVAPIGNVTLSDSKTFIGAVSVAEASYTYTRITTNTTIAALGAAGILKSLVISMPSLVTTIVYDSTLPSGTVLLKFGVNPPMGVYELNAKVANGVSVDTTSAGATPELLVLAK